MQEDLDTAVINFTATIFNHLIRSAQRNANETNKKSSSN